MTAPIIITALIMLWLIKYKLDEEKIIFKAFYIAYRWISTSHWEQRYRYVTTWVSANLTIYVGTTSYGWGVYSFAARPAGYVTITYKGNRYRARKLVIDYRPSYGGRVYAIKYICF